MGQGGKGKVQTSSYLEQLNKLLAASAPDHVTIFCEAEPGELQAVQASALGMIVSEFVANSIKHAFAGDRAGEIKISLRRQEGAEGWLLECRDNGCGPGAGARLEQPAKKNMVLIGPPGSGKGTQAPIIKDKYSLCHLATGDLLRAEVKAGSDLGKEAEAVMNRGELVSDELVLAIVRSRLQNHSGGWLLDGFPRNLAQAEALDALLSELNQPLQSVLLMELDDEELVQRLLARGRADDNEEVIRHRLSVYREQTAPLINHYEQRGQLKRVLSTGTIEAVAEQINAALA